jgi:cholesterol transport system auxiliary component
VTILRAALAAVLALALAGCISLFPKTPPAQLYQFGVNGAPPAQAGPSGLFNVQRVLTGFVDVSGGDRIVTVNGNEVAYIANARWATPAANMFDEAETRAFQNAGGPARLLRIGDAAAAPISLRLDVQTFEARYENGPKAPPTVVVSLRAVLINTLDRKVLGDEVFVSRQPAADNRVGAIVDAYDTAVTDVLGRVAAWTGQHGPA